MTGSTVIVASRNRIANDKVTDEILKNGFEAVSHAVDVQSEASVQDLFDWIRSEYGYLDYLCNAAGIAAIGSAVDCSLQSWQQVMNVNLTGTFLTCKHAIPLQQAAGGGVIVNVASDAGIAVLRKRAAYCVSKAGVIQLTKQIAIDFAEDGIRAVALAPTAVESDFLARSGLSESEIADAKVQQRTRIPLGRLITPKEVADAVVWLMSPAAASVTGSVLALDGGSILFGTNPMRQ